MRIAFFLGAFPSTSETFVANQIATLIRHNHSIEIHAWHSMGELQHPVFINYNLANLTCYRPHIPDNRLWRLIKASYLALHLFLVDNTRMRALSQLFSKIPLREWVELFFAAYPLRGGRSYDIIHAHFGPNGLMVIRLRQAGFISGKVVTSFHGYDVNVVPNALGKDYYHALFAQGEACIVSSMFIRNKLLELGANQAKVHRIAVGIDTIKWNFHIRMPWITPIVISVGRLVEVKGFAYAIAAINMVRKSIPNIQYHLIGEGPLRQQLEKQVTELDLQHQVKFFGAVTEKDIIHAFQQADLFVMPSIHTKKGAEEGQGMVVLEAQAAGLPIVATRSGGIPESVPKHSSLITEKDVDGLALAIVNRLLQSQQHGYDGREGYQFVCSHFDIKVLNHQMLNLYRSLL